MSDPDQIQMTASDIMRADARKVSIVRCTECAKSHRQTLGWLSAVILLGTLLTEPAPAGATGSGLFPVTDSEAADAGVKLRAYSQGALTLEELDTRLGDTGYLSLAVYYLTTTDAIPTNCELPISRCFGKVGMYGEAARLAAHYVGVYSNDFRGWRVLGNCNAVMGSLDQAIHCFTNAVRSGDTKCYALLAGCALKAGRFELVSALAPEMLKLQRDPATPLEYKLDLAGPLVLYAEVAEKERIAEQALSAVSLGELLSREDLSKAVLEAGEHFNWPEIRRICARIKEAQRPGRNPGRTDREE